MTNIVLSTLYGLGGLDVSLPNNDLIEQVFLVDGGDGTWTREVRDGAGNVLSSSPADAPSAPVPVADPTPAPAPNTADTATQAKLDALTVLLRAVVDTLPAESRSAVEAALVASGA